jgi:hypothetical protein
MAERAAPPWFRDGFRTAWTELCSYVTTVLRFTRAPHRFMNDWWQGLSVSMNPLAMLATGATITAASHQLAGAVLGIDHPDTLLNAALSALGPYVHYVSLGVLCHLVLAARQRGDVRLTDSIATALYAGAGPAALAESLGWIVMCVLHPFTRSTIAVGVMLGAAFSVFCFTLAMALGGLHRQPWWKMFAAFAIAFPLSGLVFGTLNPPGNYGLHWVLHVRGGFVLGLGL